MTVLIAGAGIAGLTFGLTLHQIGVPFRIYERVRRLQPMGVGINLQPNAVRELLNLGLGDVLDAVGIQTQTYGFYTKTGLEIWSEPRGLKAGYNWPQYSVHRGLLQRELLEALVARAGPGCVATGHRATGFASRGDTAVLHLETANGPVEAAGDLIIAADGIHSALRAQLYPDEGAPIWNGAVLWRGTTLGKPFLSAASMCLAGHDTQRIVVYPITPPDPETGLQTLNWIAELKFDPAGGWRREDWSREADIGEFAPAFDDWRFDWLDVPTLIRGAEKVYEYPMVDRDPVDRWTEGRMTLIGDAAHPTYPVGSNGASQAILDARVLGRQILDSGPTSRSLEDFEAIIRPKTRGIILANRGSGPDAVMQLVEDRCGGVFDDIDDVVPREQLAEHARRYKEIAGFSVAELNAERPIIELAE